MSAALSSLVTLKPSSSSWRGPSVPLMHLQGVRGVGSMRVSCRNSHSTKIFSQQSGGGTEVVLETKNEDSKSADTIEKANGAITDSKEDVKTDKEQGDSFSSAVFRGFEDPRWKNGTWDLLKFTKDGKVDWDAVIDAEVYRRKMLEQNPEASTTDNPVVFDTSIVPWWAWMKRFHLPEAELLNGRAAMVGFFMAYFIDSLTGVGIVDQTSSFFGKLFLFIAVVGVLVVRRNEDLETVKNLIKESTFYDKQWQATWQNQTDQQDQDKK